jgi:hypothetical protein
MQDSIGERLPFLIEVSVSRLKIQLASETPVPANILPYIKLEDRGPNFPDIPLKEYNV